MGAYVVPPAAGSPQSTRRVPLDLREVFPIPELQDIADKYKIGFLDSAGDEIVSSTEAKNWCGVLQSAGSAYSRCHDCALRLRPSQPARQRLEWVKCANSLDRALLPITTYSGQMVGWVIGRPFVTAQIEPIIKRLRDRKLRSEAELVLKMPTAREHIQTSMSRGVNEVLPRYLDLRRKQITDEARRNIPTARVVDDVYAVLFGGIKLLFGELKGVYLWKESKDSQGECFRLVKPGGREARDENARVKRDGTHLQLAIRKGAPHYEPRLRKGAPSFTHTISTPWPKSVFTIPLRLGAHGENGAIQLQSDMEDFFRLESDRETVIQLAVLAATVLSRIALRRELTTANLRAEGADLVAGLLLDVTRSRSDILKQKQEVYSIFARQLYSIAGPDCVAASVRLVNRLTNVMGFVATEGPGFSDHPERMQMQYSPQKNGCAHKALRDGRVYYRDTEKRGLGEDYYPLIPETRCLLILSFEVHGERAGIVAVDYKAKDSCPPEVQEKLAALITQFERVLEVLEDRQELMISDLLRPLSENESLERAGSAIVEEVADMFEARACALFLDRNQEGVVRLEARTGPDGGRESYPLGTGITGWVAAEQKTVRIWNTMDRQELNRVQDLYGVPCPLVHERSRRADGRRRSVLMAPLVALGRTLGVIRLSVKNGEDNGFSVGDETVLQELAGKLSLALDARWVDEDKQNQLSELKGEKGWRDRFKKADGLTQACQVLCDQLEHRTRARGAYLRFLDPEVCIGATVASGILDMLPSLSEAPQQPPPGTPAQDIWATPDWQPFCTTLRERFSDLASELIQAGQSVEVRIDHACANLVLVWQSPRHVRNSVETELADLKEGLQAALSQARTQKRQEDANKDLQCLQDLAIACTSENNLKRNCEAILKVALDEVGLSDGSIRLLRLPDDWELFATTAESEETAPAMIRTNYLLRRCLALREPFVVGSSDTERIQYVASIDSKARRARLEQFAYIIAVPLRGNDACLGTITLESRKQGALSDRHRHFLRTLGQYASVAIQSVQLREKEMEARPFEILGTMFGGLSHVLRNRATCALTTTCLLETGMLQAEERQLNFLVVKEELHKILSICTDLKQASSREIAPMAPLCVNNLWIPVWDSLPADAKAGVALHHRLDPGQPLILGNTTQIQVALVMLAMNALDALTSIPAPRKLIYWTRQRRGNVEILIGDNGKGMDKETKEHCLDLFYTTKTKGSGMGLAVVKTIARRHGCALSVHTRVDKGTIWKLRFPRFED